MVLSSQVVPIETLVYGKRRKDKVRVEHAVVYFDIL